MEDILSHITKEANGSSKYVALCKACKEASDLLEDAATSNTAEAYHLRERCLVPLRLGLESRNTKLVASAIQGIQTLLQEDRFQSSIEAEEEGRWLPMQVMDTITNLSCMNNETQVDVLKLLLNMTFTSVWCTNAKVVTRITEVLVSAYGPGSHGSVRSAARATITQLLSSVAEKFKEDFIDYSINDEDDYDDHNVYDHDENLNSSTNSEPDAVKEIAEFLENKPGKLTDETGNDIAYILYYLCAKMSAFQKEDSKHQAVPLLMEGIYAILSHVPTSIHKNRKFLEVVWQQLCPTMIGLLGNPLQDKNVVSMQKQHTAGEDHGRGSGCSSKAPQTDSTTAKTLYNVAVELVRLVSSLQSLRPVVESVLHRMLLYPPPVYRLEAIKSLSPILNNPERLLELAGPTIPDPQQNNEHQRHNKKNKAYSSIAPLKLIVDSLQECCHCNDSVVCMTSVGLVGDLVNSLDKLAKGQGVDEDLIFEIHKQCMDMETNSVVSSRADLETGSVSSSFAVTDDDKNKDAEDTEYDSDYRIDSSDIDENLNKPVFDKVENNKFDKIANSENKNIEIEMNINEHLEDKLLTSEEHTKNEKTCQEAKDSNEDKKANDSDPADTENGNRILSNGSRCNNAAFQRQCSNSVIEVVNNKDSRDQQERQNARKYIRELIRALPDWLTSMYSPEVDEMIQRFSSDVCAAQQDDEYAVILNADGVYVVTYSILSLNLKLIRTGYYESEEKSLPLAEQQFVDELLDTSELMLYLSPYWLSEVFLQTIQTNFLEVAGYRDMGRDNCEESALIQLLTDIDGLGSRKIGGQLLCSASENVDALLSPRETEFNDNPLAVQAGMKFARKILLTCGDAIVDVLSVLINGKSACGITSSLSLMFNAKEESRRARETICTSLGALQTTAKLACMLGVQERCGAVFQELVTASCIIEEIKQLNQKSSGLPNPLSNKPKMARLHAAHSLSLDLVLTMGLEMGSHSRECWRHVFRCCAHISELEHIYFSSGSNTAAKVLPSLAKPELQDPDLFTPSYAMDLGEEHLFSPMALEPVAPTINVTELIQQSSVEAGWDSPLSSRGILSSEQASKILCGLSQKVDHLFEDATNQLNMKALVDFLSELCNSSQKQLNTYFRHMESGQLSINSLHLYRLGDVILRCIRGDRPLLHIMKCWAVVAPHLIEAACHRDRSISKKAVTCIHEIVTWLLSNRLELPYFHLHEALCKPYENLLCLELCDGDVQDQIVCSICELVEACTTEIKSGWRPLFGALRAVRIKYTTNEEVNEARQRHVTAVLDVFEVFLNTDNVLVFAYAAVDCILCLLKYVRGPSEFEEYPDDDSDSSGTEYQGTSSEDLILPALRYLKKCCKILSSMWEMPASPTFHGASSIQMAAMPKCVDPVIPGFNLEEFQKPFFDNHSSEERPPSPVKEPSPGDHLAGNSMDSGIGFHYPIPCAGPDKKQNIDDNGKPQIKTREEVLKELSKGDSEEIPLENGAEEEQKLTELISHELKKSFTTAEHHHVSPLLTYKPLGLNKLDNSTGVLRVWFLVLEGLATTLIECPKNYQPQTVEMFMTLLKAAAESPGPEFSLYCINHLVLPTLQNWVRKGSHTIGYWNSSATANFKHCMGLCADLVVEYIVRFASEKIHVCASEFMLHQLLIVLTECVAQPFESLSRLGCACIRHSLLSCGPVLSENMWHIAVTALKHACDVSLYCLRQLMTPFQEDSENFYGDIGQVKVAVRKDCSGIECERIRQLAQQVFFLDSQRNDCLVVDYEKEEDRSYILLIYPPTKNSSEQPSDDQVSRVPFRSLVVGLLSHQILIQTVGTILLQGCKNMVDNEREVISSSAISSEVPKPHGDAGEDEDESGSLPGLMRYMSCRNLVLLLECLHSSFTTAQQFDLRPGLKFLMQKVARCQVAANLYKQTGLSLIFYVHTLLEIAARQSNLNVQGIKEMLLNHEIVLHSRSQSTSDQPSDWENDDHNHEQKLESSEKCESSEENCESSEDKYKSSEDIEKSASKECESVDNSHGKSEIIINNTDKQIRRNIASNLNYKSCITSEHEIDSTSGIKNHMDMFVYKLKEIFDVICTKYIDMYLEKEGPNAADKLSTKLLVFLLAPEDLPTIKRDKSIRELVEEKLRGKQRQLSEDEESPISIAAEVPQTQHTFLSSPVPLEDQQEPLKELSDSLDTSEDESSPFANDHIGSASGSHKYGEGVDKVYEVATDKTIESLMHEYKKRKQAQTMPTFVKQQRSKPKQKPKIEKTPSIDPAEKKIEDEHKKSMVADSDAQLVAYVEVICNLIQLFLHLTDGEFKALLPTMFNFINQLTCHCRHRSLRDSLAQWTFRIGQIYDFSPPGFTTCPKTKYD